MWTWLFLACSSGDPHAEPALPKVAEKAKDPVAAEHMKEHFDDATIALEGWISGDLPTASKHLTWLGEHRPPAAMAKHPDDLRAMQRAALLAAQGGPPEKVAKQLTAIALACGDCHTHSGAAPKLEIPPAPPPSKKLSAHMTGHLWAVNTMWAGLVTHDDTMFAKGASALDAEPAHGFEDEQQALAVRVHELGREARAATTRDQRADGFAQIIGTCARCHVDTRGE